MTAGRAEDADVARQIARALLDDHEMIASQMVEAIDRGVTEYADTGDARQVLADVRNGFVSLAKAREDYFVVIDPATLEADLEATYRLRGSPA